MPTISGNSSNWKKSLKRRIPKTLSRSGLRFAEISEQLVRREEPFVGSLFIPSAKQLHLTDKIYMGLFTPLFFH